MVVVVVICVLSVSVGMVVTVVGMAHRKGRSPSQSTFDSWLNCGVSVMDCKNPSEQSAPVAAIQMDWPLVKPHTASRSATPLIAREVGGTLTNEPPFSSHSSIPRAETPRTVTTK